MSIAEKFEVIADEVYEKGKEYIWDVVQQGGTRKDYSMAFYLWDIDYIRPKYKITPTDVASGNQTFYKCKIKKIEKEYFDFSQKPYGTSGTHGWYYTFSTCTNLEEIPDIGMQAAINYSYCFSWSGKLHTIEVIRCDKGTTWNGAFTSCNNLQNITIEGTIGQNNFNVKDCKKLTVASLLSILTALSKDSSIATGKSITFSTVHKDIIEGDAECLEQYNLAISAGWEFLYA